MNTRFEIEPDYADALRAAGLANFDTLFNATPSGPPTSRHKHRETVPIEFDVNGKRQRFFLKRVFKVPGQHSWRPWLRGKPGYSQPVREWDNIKMMRDAGLPVMKRVAVGERRKFGIPVQAFILVEDVGIPWTLENWMVPGFSSPPGVDAASRIALWQAVGVLMGRIAHAGIYSWDFGAKHIHVDRCTDSNKPGLRLALIDVERVELENGGKCYFGTPTEFALWTTLFSSLMQPGVHVTDEELAAFQAGYTGIEPSRHDQEDVQFFCAMARDDYLPKSNPMDDPGFQRVSNPRSKTWLDGNGIRIDALAKPILQKLGLSSLTAAFSIQAGDQMRKPGLAGHRDRIRLTATDADGNPVYYFMKRYSRPPLGEQLRRIWEAGAKRSTARREAKAVELLNGVGVPTMEVVAYGEEMRAGCECRSFIVTRAVPGESLESFAKRCRSDAESRPNASTRLAIIRKLAHITQIMHTHGLYHRDLYLSHIFVNWELDNEAKLFLIDLARVPLCKRARPDRWRFKDLAALAYSTPIELASRTDRQRFLRWYLDWGDDDGRMNRTFVRKINNRVTKMARHDAKRAARFAGQNVASTT